MKNLTLSLMLACVLLVAACGGEEPTPTPPPPAVEAPVDTPTPAEVATPTAAPTAAPAEAVTDTGAVTGTEAITGTGAVTSTEPATTTTPLTATETTTDTAGATAETGRVTVENVSFVADPALASGWTGGLVEDNSNMNVPPDLTIGPRRVLIEGEGDDLSKPYLFVFNIADLVGKPEQAAADALAELLATGADLAATPALPYLPRINASQAVHGAEQTLDFASGQGIRYVTAYAQDPSPFTGRSFMYTFQGLTSEGQAYVAFIAPLATELFPTELPADFDYAAHEANYTTYLTETKATISGAAPADFSPDLATLDALVQSITIGAAAAAPAASTGPVDFTGTYTASLPGPDLGRPVTLTLSADGAATLTTDNLNGEGPVAENGSWTPNEDGTATLTLTGTAPETYDQPNVITFTLTNNLLAAVDFSQPELYGTVGLQLQKLEGDAGATSSAPPAELADVTWQLVKITNADGSEVTPDDPSKYTLAFGSDWRVAVRADCNQGGGPYDASDGKLAIGRLISTRAACLEGSLYDEYMKNLETVATYEIADGMLTIALVGAAGMMQFAPAQ